jgi:hypothetical protein
LTLTRVRIAKIIVVVAIFRMTDAYDRLYQGISEKLTSKADREILKELVDLQRKGGKEILEEKIQELVDKVGGDV